MTYKAQGEDLADAKFPHRVLQTSDDADVAPKLLEK